MMPRSNFEIYASILNLAKKGALKWHIRCESKSKDALRVLLEAGMLSIDESKLQICKNGVPRKVVYKTTEKANVFLDELHGLQELLRKEA